MHFPWQKAFIWQVAAVASADQVVLDSGLRPESLRTYNVAIIGAGAAGASSAYHLAQFAIAAGFPVNITVLEMNDFVGGRSTTANAYNSTEHPLELGASIFVEKNQILLNATKAFNLTTSSTSLASRSPDIPGPALGIWDGERFVVTQNNEGSWWDTAKLLYKYGLSPIRTLRLMRATTEKFFQMYDTPVFPFLSLTQAAMDVGLLAVTAATGEQYLRENNIGTLFAREIVQASTRVNYAQNLDHIHGLEAMVCMAAQGAMAVEGGNWQIFDQMIASSNASLLLNAQVSSIDRDSNGLYTLEVNSLAQEQALDSFDEVIIATPYQFSELDIRLDSAIAPRKIDYVKLHATLFTSPHLMDPAFFDLAAGKATPHAVITTLPEGEHAPARDTVGSPGFYSISMLREVINPTTDASEYAYKIFSPSPVEDAFLAKLLGVSLKDHKVDGKDLTWMYRKVWNSYPYEVPRAVFEDIKLDDGLWYTSGIESFISTMETSALMGRNIAKLIVDEWENKRSM